MTICLKYEISISRLYVSWRSLFHYFTNQPVAFRNPQTLTANESGSAGGLENNTARFAIVDFSMSSHCQCPLSTSVCLVQSISFPTAVMGAALGHGQIVLWLAPD